MTISKRRPICTIVTDSPVSPLELAAGGLRVNREQKSSGVSLVPIVAVDRHLPAPPEEGAVGGPHQGHCASRPVAVLVVVLDFIPVLPGLVERVELVEVYVL